MKLPIGTRVLLRKDSQFYDQCDDKPLGVITEYTEDHEFLYRIKWGNGLENTYREVDIKISFKMYYDELVSNESERNVMKR